MKLSTTLLLALLLTGCAPPDGNEAIGVVDSVQTGYKEGLATVRIFDLDGDAAYMTVCQFDNGAEVGDLVIASQQTQGECHDTHIAYKGKVR